MAIIKALRAFDDLPWVGIPVASAFLTALHPCRFTVIDRQAYKALSVDFPGYLKPDEYRAYLSFCRRQAADLGVSLRVYDRALWQLGWERGRRAKYQEACTEESDRVIAGRETEVRMSRDEGRGFNVQGDRATAVIAGAHGGGEHVGANVDQGIRPLNQERLKGPGCCMTIDADAVVRRISSYADGKPQLEIHVAKSQADQLPITQNGALNINLKVGKDIWQAKLRRTVDCKYIWISPTIYLNGERGRLVDALGNYQPNDRVILRVHASNSIEVLLARIGGN